MKKNLALEYMRIVGMLGVLAIHVGSLIVGIPDFSKTLFFIYEVFSRYGIPIFFFISGFGLFAKIDTKQPFDYKRFLHNSFFRLLLIYMFWSALYLFHYGDYLIGTGIRYRLQEYFYALILGYGGFHLYFVLLLIIFYLLMPLWIRILDIINSGPRLWLPLMLVGQIVFNYLMLRYFKYHTGIKFFDNIYQFQLNLIVFYYFSTFMLGAYIGNNQAKSSAWLNKHRQYVYLAFVAAFANLTYTTYEYFCIKGYSMLQVTFTLHQLSTPGYLYCTTFILASFVFFNNCKPENIGQQQIFRFLAGASDIVYFSHPFFLYYISEYYKAHREIDELGSLLIYVVVLCSTLLLAYIWRQLKQLFK